MWRGPRGADVVVQSLQSLLHACHLGVHSPLGFLLQRLVQPVEVGLEPVEVQLQSFERLQRFLAPLECGLQLPDSNPLDAGVPHDPVPLTYPRIQHGAMAEPRALSRM